MLKFQGAGLGYRRDLADGFLSLQDNSIINFMEVSPENWLKMGELRHLPTLLVDTHGEAVQKTVWGFIGIYLRKITTDSANTVGA